MSAAGVTLKDSVITGNLYLTEGIVDGNVLLENVKVGGKIFVNGGGEHSIVLNDSSTAGMIIGKADGKLRIAAAGTTSLGNVRVRSGVKLEEAEGLTGEGFTQVIVEGSLLKARSFSSRAALVRFR